MTQQQLENLEASIVIGTLIVAIAPVMFIGLWFTAVLLRIVIEWRLWI